jgi:phosphoglycerol transferase MdoB-like AlkP superfamily enzyme
LLDEKGVSIVESGYGKTVDKYLALARESDKAFKELVEYYGNCEEPTIIVMFGDHQPKLDNSFFETVAGKPIDNMLTEPTQNLYKTPFVIWANYPIEEKDNVNISINYLSILMLEQTGIPITVYQYYLSKVMEQIPIINNNGFIDKNGNTYRTISDLTETLQKFANTYHLFEYNLAFDKENILNLLNIAK